MWQLEDIEDLRPAPYNPREISDDAAKGLRASIQRFGDISGIVWNRRTGTLVAGHQRVEQLRGLGAELDDGALVLEDGSRFHIRVVDLDTGDEMAANLSANNAHIAGEFTADARDVLDDVKGLIGDAAFVDLKLPSIQNLIKDPVFEPAGDFGGAPLDEQQSTQNDDTIRCPECGHVFEA